MAEPTGYLQWNVQEIASALKIRREDVLKYFTDGRKVAFIFERRLTNEFLGGDLACSEGADYDICDEEGLRWEVRSISTRTYFCPSYMVGSGRKFNEEGFLRKIKGIAGYILVDIGQFPNVPFWKVAAADVLLWYKNGHLGAGTHTSRPKVLQLIKELP
ncbi:MAG TPA: hypothetical protein VLE43_03875 [Candidatus Saccharimonadia bacterium]|nr:hypothetical protein [Candidatus Saccharimonadia bacterium]